MTMGRRKGRSLAALGFCLLAAVPARAAEESAAAFFRGKQVRFYTMGSPGGGYDTYMRALVPHLEKKLGAKMLPSNETGAGGFNRTINAPADGLTILLVGGETLVTAQLYDSPGVNYDVRKLAWLARVSSEAKVALLGPKSPYRSVLDLATSETPVTWAGSSKIDGNTDFTALMAYALGMKAKMITGYKGTGGTLPLCAARWTAASCPRNPPRSMGRATACAPWPCSRASA
jgi:tripartite-type tricarboxylate transporter receptor subunit TctC